MTPRMGGGSHRLLVSGSYDSLTVGAGSIVNEVEMAYDGFGQLVTEYEEHSGAVNFSTTPEVQYAYADGSDNNIRPTAVSYPGGRRLHTTTAAPVRLMTRPAVCSISKTARWR